MSDVTSRLFTRLKAATNVVFSTGAGISAESGIPTFRGKDGLWNKYNPRDLASMEAFLRNPGLVWEWYSWRRNLVRTAKPNLGHYAVTDMQDYFEDFYVITQNVDGLHARAGTKNIIELHGNILRNKCIKCSRVYDDAQLKAHEATQGKAVPSCPFCKNLIRPDVVWFGEALPKAPIAEAQRRAAAAEIFFSVGTSAQVEPAASLPYLAKGNGALIVEVNREQTPLSSVADIRLSRNAAEALPALSMQIEKLRRRNS